MHQNPKRNPAFERLETLVGEWATESPQFPEEPGREVFEWMEEGAFLVRHASADETSYPAVVAIIGLDDSNETFHMLYYDSRGVSRVYKMSLSDGVWKMWREAPGFSQRFNGVFSQDGNSITAYWELSTDGVNWERDFDLTFTRVG